MLLTTDDYCQELTKSESESSLPDVKDFGRLRLMLDGWELLRVGHQTLAGTGAAPGAMFHAERANDAWHHARQIGCILDELDRQRKQKRKRK